MDSYSKNSLFCENCNDITAHHFDEDWGMVSAGGLGGRDPFYYECTICGKRTKSGELTKKQMESLRKIEWYEKVSEIANSLRKKGKISQDQKDFRGATGLYVEGLQLCQKIGNIVGIVTFLDDLGTIDLYSKNYTAALQKYNEAYSLLCQEGLEDSSLAQDILRNIQHINEIK